jgi:hypothetical protein
LFHPSQIGVRANRCAVMREREREREREENKVQRHLWMVSWHLLFYKILDGNVVKYFFKNAFLIDIFRYFYIVFNMMILKKKKKNFNTF